MASFCPKKTLTTVVGHTLTASSRNFLQENQKETYTDFF